MDPEPLTPPDPAVPEPEPDDDAEDEPAGWVSGTGQYRPEPTRPPTQAGGVG